MNHLTNADRRPMGKSVWAILISMLLLLGACGLGDSSGSELGSEVVDEDANDSTVTDDGDGTVVADDSDDPDKEDDPDESTSSSSVDVAGYNPTFTSGSCDFDAPADADMECGTVTVPSNWESGEGTIELAVARIMGPGSAADPVVLLEGGPGGHALEPLNFAWNDVVTPLTERGDVIAFDQRGAGLSEPRLQCDESTEVIRTLEDDPEIDDDTANTMYLDSLSECRERLIGEGVVLEDFNSINNAHDVEALRLALGYDNWNLLGVSYGTKLGLEVMRQHPDGVRSVILDSVYPQSVDSVRDNPTTFLESYENVIEACNAEPACSSEGDLGERIKAVIADLEADPIQIEVQNWITGETDDIYVTGDSIAGLVTSGLYSPTLFTDFPELVSELEQGETAALVQFLSQDRSTEALFSDGMFYAFACNEEISFADPDEVEAALPADPFGLEDDFDLASNTGTSAFATCEAFENGQAPDSSNIAVESDIPALLLAGFYDPVTPISWAEEAAKTLSDSHVVVAPNGSHGISGSSSCGMSIVLSYLDNLGDRPSDSCLADEELFFLAAPDNSIELEDATYQVSGFGVSISTVRPTDWTVGSLGGDQYRSQSFLDPTQFFQLAGVGLGLGLESYFQTNADLELGELGSFPASVGPITAADLSKEWSYRSGSTGDLVADWFETDIDGETVYVILVSTEAERDDLLKNAVLPGLEAIGLE